jgi:hypothetical protein
MTSEPLKVSKQTKSKLKVKLINLLIISLLALSLVFQPTGWRLGLFSVSQLAIFLILLWGFASQTFNLMHLLTLLIIVGFLVISDLIISMEYRGIILASLIASSFFISRFDLDEKGLYILWNIILFSCSIILYLAVWRYIFGIPIAESENLKGVSGSADTYFYLGISYLPSTRNSDALYFILGLLSALRLFASTNKMRLVYASFSGLFAIAVVLSLSRGAILCMLIFLLLMFPLKFNFIGLRRLLAVSLGIIVSVVFVYRLLGEAALQVARFTTSAFVSLYDPVSANSNVAGIYKYSNHDRVDLYKDAVNQFLVFPFGQGVDSQYFGVFGGNNFLHSENLFLDFIIIFGVFSLPIFFVLLRKMKNAYALRNESVHLRFAYSAFAVCAVFCLFNSPINLIVFWFLYSVSALEFNFGKKKNKVIKPIEVQSS